jgi:hypothetical protein
MSVIGSNILAGASGQGGGYNLTNSLRFRSSASAYLNRTPASAGNRQTWTFSFWVKRATLSTEQRILFSNDNGLAHATVVFTSGNALALVDYTDPSPTYQITTTQLFRDVSAWYHIVAVFNTTSATSSDRMQLYVNGSRITAFSTADYPTQNFNGYTNNNVPHGIGARIASPVGNYFDGYLTEINMVDGLALTPSSFGQTSTTTGVWIPKKYTGTYGTNGFYLPFTNTSSTSTLGNDFSGNSNTWTVNNISLTAGSTYDSMTDVPTLTSATAANYAVMNPLNKASLVTVTDGNLTLSPSSASWGAISGTVAVTSGKWYYEYSASISSPLALCGWATTDEDVNTTYGSAVTKQWEMIFNSGNKYGNGANAVAYASAVSANTVVGVALDMDNGTLTFYIGGVSQGTAFSTGLTGKTLVPWISVNSGGGAFSSYVNFGQRPFTYTPPSGFVGLNTFNLPTPTIGATASTTANKYMNVVTYTGTGSSLSVTGVGFQPDWTWIKGRSGATDHGLYDAVRGVQIQLESNSSGAETTETTGLTAFGSDGFTVGALAQLNTSSATYVGWNWKANGAGSSNTAGSITSTVSASTTAGFSIVTYTGTGANATVGHGLGVAPSMYIVKRRNAGGDNWAVYHVSTGNTQFLRLDTNNVAQTFNLWQNTTPTSSVFYLTSDVGVNGSGSTFVAYCFAQVAGYSAFGSYTGNGSSNGTFVYTGFRPKFVLTKSTVVAHDWNIWDSSRSPYNAAGLLLQPNISGAEQSPYNVDLLSNGFKFYDSNATWNGSGETYIYMAFAENPFKYANAR